MSGVLWVPASAVAADHEAWALDLFSSVLKDDMAAKMRPVLLRMRPKCVPRLDARDLVWLVCEASMLVFARHVVPWNKPLRAEHVDRMFGIGLAGVAGTVPEWLSEIGYDALICSLIAVELTDSFVPVKSEGVLTPAQAHAADQVRSARTLVQREWTRGSGEFHKWWGRHHYHPLKDPFRTEDIQDVFRFLDGRFIAHRRVPQATAKRQLVDLLRRRGLPVENDNADAVDLAFNTYWVHRETHPARGDARFGPFVGSDGLWHADTRGMADAYDSPSLKLSRGVSLDHIDPDSVDAMVGNNSSDLQSSPAEAAIAGEMAELIPQVITYLRAALLDDLDRKDFELLEKGEHNRSARARAIGLSEGALRKREGVWVDRAAAEAPPPVRALIEAWKGRAGVRSSRRRQAG